MSNPPRSIPSRTRSLPVPGYAIAMTSCIAAACQFGESENGIVLCSDRRIDYGHCLGAHERGFKMSMAGPGWMALMAGPTSRCHALLSLYWKHLNSKPPLRPDNVWQEMQVPLAQYKAALRSHGFPAGKCPELLLTGFIGGMPYIFKVVETGSDEDEVSLASNGFECIGSGYFLAHYSFLNRRYQGGTEAQEAMYYVYEAKRWSELETGVNKSTFMCVQRPSRVAGGITIDLLREDGLRKLSRMYKRLGPQPYEHGDVSLGDVLHLTATSPDPQLPTADPLPPPPSQE